MCVCVCVAEYVLVLRVWLCVRGVRSGETGDNEGDEASRLGGEYSYYALFIDATFRHPTCCLSPILVVFDEGRQGFSSLYMRLTSCFVFLLISSPPCPIFLLISCLLTSSPPYLASGQY